jgi:universal stress protein E
VSLSSRLQRLLVATDLSVRAEHAFNRAVQLALQNNAKLTVLHVIPDELEPSFSEALKQQARKALDSLVAQAMAKGELQIEIAIKGGLDREQIMKQVAQAAAHGETSVEVRIEPGSVYDIINETAATIDADLVICGVHRRLIIGDEWLGSTIDRVIRFGNRPVLVVKKPAEKAYEKILVGTDFSDQAAEALKFALAAFPSAHFTLVNAFESTLPGFLTSAHASSQAIDKRLEELRQFSETVMARTKADFGISDLKVDQIVREGDALEVLKQLVEERDIDLTVVGTHGRTGLRRAILGSVSESAIAKLPCDVLATRPKTM